MTEANDVQWVLPSDLAAASADFSLSLSIKTRRRIAAWWWWIQPECWPLYWSRF